MGACCDNRVAVTDLPKKTITDSADSLVPRILRGLQRHGELQRSRSVVSSYREAESAVRSNPEKSANDKALIVSLLQRKLLFADSSAQDLDRFVEAMSFFTFQAGDIVVREDELPHYLFLLAEGRIGLSYKGNSLGEVSREDEFSLDSFFGETPRATTGQALEPTGLWGVDKDTFNELYKQFKREESARLKMYLDSAPVFMNLLPVQKESLQKVMEIIRLEAGALVVQEGSIGNSCFLIKVGTVACSKDGVEIRRLGPGEIFGEQTLLYGGLRTATVRTVTTTVLWKVESEDMVLVLGDHLDRIIYRNSIRIAFDGNSLLSRLSLKQKDRLISRMNIATFIRGNVGISTKSNQLFVVLHGSLQSSLNPANTLQTFSIIGVLESNSESKRKVEDFLVTSDTAVIACIDQETMEVRLQGSIVSAIGCRPTPSDLKKFSLFQEESDAVLRSLAKCAVVRSFSPGEVIISEENCGSSLYVIASGEVDVTQKDSFLRSLGVLDYFGERAVLHHSHRTATVTACADTLCWSFEKEKLPIQNQKDSMRRRLLWRIQLQDDPTQLADLVVVRRIPKDVPGASFLVIHSTKLTFYMLQVVEKTALTPQGQCDFEREKAILQSLYHPFLLPYIKFLEDSRFTYILTVYIENFTDLFEVLRDFGRPLTNDEGKFYISCLVLFVEFLHRRKIAIRNLQPEIILIDASGYPQICNLEYAKKLSEKTFTMIGTPHYMPPEMITSKGYGLAVDYWSLGVILYESLCGKVPFGEDEVLPMKVYSQVLNGELSFPAEIDDCAREVIDSLLERQPSRRAKGSLCKLKKLPWFQGMDWVRVI